MIYPSNSSQSNGNEFVISKIPDTTNANVDNNVIDNNDSDNHSDDSDSDTEASSLNSIVELCELDNDVKSLKISEIETNTDMLDTLPDDNNKDMSVNEATADEKIIKISDFNADAIDVDYKKLSLTQLRTVANDRGIKDNHKMKKQELLKLLSN